VQTTGRSRRLADDGRHFTDPAVRVRRYLHRHPERRARGDFQRRATIEATPQPIDYHRRRTALRDWCIDPASWTTIVDQLSGHSRGQHPDLGDRQRDCASIIVWSRITGSERLFAPHPIRDQQPTDIAEQWRQRAHDTFARVRDDTGHPRDAALNQILTAYAQWLIRAIDATGTTPPGPWTGTHPQTSGGISTRDLDSRPHR
jgi:hypothetical protein